MGPDMYPAKIETLKRKYAAGEQVYAVEHSMSVSIDSISRIGSNFWFVNFTVTGRQLQVLLDPGGRSTDTGRFPFWEIW